MKKKIRIAMLGHKRIPSREGGIEIVVEELCTRMAKLGHSVTCYNRAGHHVSGGEFDSADLKLYKGVRLLKVLTIEKKGLAAVTASFFASVRAAFGKYDVVHFHAEGPCATMWICKLLGKRCIATVHGLDHQRAKWGKFAKTYIMMGEKNAVKHADEIIVLSRNVQEYFEKTYNRKTLYIPNGVNRPKLRKAELLKEKFGQEKDSYILFLARLVPEKGIENLIKAFKKVKTDKKLLIAGGSSDTEEFINKMKSLAASDERIVFTGFVHGQILEELYSNAYVYVLPSELEGMPISLLEAMSYSNCCLTSDISECTEVVGDYACSFKKGDAEDLRKQLQYLVDNVDVVRKYKKNASDYICSKYDWDNVTELTLKAYCK